eukprot:TRINITY_DN1407_c0_g2_i1.p1 TRINITY_DN1407_c0_g2~~TRINITY_DN1407_c0_g2_i1.p1  ORF type:complete len:182 (-),score=55.53 TRINITY_DN1407_c0_g2_i1:132-677(-)
MEYRLFVLAVIVSLCFQGSFQEEQAREDHTSHERRSQRHKYTTEEVNTHRKDFKEFDTNDDGVITPQEFKDTLPELTRGEIEDFFQAADKNNDDLIDLEEYLAAAIEDPLEDEGKPPEELVHAESAKQEAQTEHKAENTFSPPEGNANTEPKPSSEAKPEEEELPEQEPEQEEEQPIKDEI